MDYLVISTAVTDDIYFPDGTCKKQLAGGAGIYALSGIKIWSDEVMIVTGVGNDYSRLHGDWFKNNRLSENGLMVRDEFTPRTLIHYRTDGEREETPVFGPAHYSLMEAKPEEIARHCMGVKGVYIFKRAIRQYWEQIFQLRKKFRFTLMWEIAADAAIPENQSLVTSLLKQIDIFSINRQEAFSLFSCRGIDDLIPQLKLLDIPLVFLRLGSDGAVMITREEIYSIPSLADARVVDNTGGGNSSSGAVLVGYCENKDPRLSGIMGSISAAYSIAQFGPPPLIDETVRTNAVRLAMNEYEKISKRLMNE